MTDADSMVYLNGRFVPQEAAQVSVTDRGLIFGDGVYEALRFYAGRPFAMPRHLARLRRSLAAIDLQPTPLIESLPRVSLGLAERNGHHDGLIYWQVTRGPGPRDRRYPRQPQLTVLAMTSRALPLEAPGPAKVTAVLQEDMRWARCDIKAITLLPTVLAKNRALAAGADEALFHREGVLTEATAANALAVVDGELRTHPIQGGRVLPGVTRAAVLDVAAELGVPVREQAVTLDELERAEEIMLTGTTTRVTVVTHLDGRAIGTGDTGPVAQRLFDGFVRRVAGECGLVVAAR